MTALYLLFEWTEEREGKNFIGIFSTIEKAKQAAQITFDAEGGDDDVEGYQLEWKTELGIMPGKTVSPYAPKGSGRDAAEFPYQIDEFTLDTFVVSEFDETAREWGTRETTL